MVSPDDFVTDQLRVRVALDDADSLAAERLDDLLHLGCGRCVEDVQRCVHSNYLDLCVHEKMRISRRL